MYYRLNIYACRGQVDFLKGEVKENLETGQIAWLKHQQQKMTILHSISVATESEYNSLIYNVS